MPSNHLVDLFVSMAEDGILSYVKPEVCTSRAQEIQLVKKDKSVGLDAAGNIKLSVKDPEQHCDTSGDVKLRAAFQRRSLAIDQSRLATFGIVEAWIHKIFLLREREPPKGFSRLTLGQIVDADKQLWTLASNNTMGTLTSAPGSVKPLDREIEVLMNSPEILQFLILSRAYRDAGFEAISIDHHVNSNVAPIVIMDLTSSSGQELLWAILKSRKPLHVHMGVPCGTSSRARERPLPQHLLSLGLSSPKPLRDALHPLGLPGLSSRDSLRVSQANILYELCVDIILWCAANKVLASIENPARSWAWSAMTVMVRQRGPDACQQWNTFHNVDFHSCCHGGDRKKFTRFLVTDHTMDTLAQLCQDDHPHKPFGISHGAGGLSFDTALEASYPKLLCQRVVSCTLQLARNLAIPVTPPVRPKELATATVGLQSRRHKQLVPEYKRIAPHAQPFTADKSCKILAPHLYGGVSEEDDEKSVKYTHGQVRVGHFHSPLEFLCRASDLQHPMDSSVVLHVITRQALDSVFSWSPEKWRMIRKKALLEAKVLALKLSGDESSLKSSLAPSVQKVVAAKRIFLWEALLKKYDFDDMGVCTFMRGGVQLVGMPETPQCFEPHGVPAVSTEGDLRATAIWRRKALLGRSRPHEEIEHRRHLVEVTDDEVARGFMDGPYFSEQEVSQKLGMEDWCAMRRFVLVQGAEQKLRPIDDALESQLNTGYTSTFKLRLQDTDYISSLALELSRRALHVDGGGRLAHLRQWHGRCLDLSKAYKQLAVAADHRSLAVIFFVDPEERTRFYIPNSLMFGSTAAVYSFNRVSRSLW